jgi:hypothetical protein
MKEADLAGSCGVWHKNSDATIALSAELMNIWPGQTSNPNLSPVCGQRMQINCGSTSFSFLLSRANKSVDGGKSLIAEVQVSYTLTNSEKRQPTI